MLYPQQNDIRNKLTLSGFWDFKTDPEEVGEAQKWFSGLEDSRLIAVPGSWNEQFEDLYDYLGMSWYVREDVYIPSAWQDQKIYIRVGSANYSAQVWVNGNCVGSHEGGHLPFAFEISEQVYWNEPNVIAIQIENHLKPNRIPAGNLPQSGAGGGFSLFNGYPRATFDFYPYAGIHRPVILYSLPETSIEDVTVITDIQATTGIVNVTVQQSTQEGTGKVILKDKSGTIEESLTFENGIAEVALEVANAKFWGPESPHLYDLDIILNDDDEILDRYSLEIGIRTVEVRGAELLLNGKPVFLKGFGRHEDFYVSGRGLNEPLIVKDYSLMRWIGANSYRTSHYPYSEEEMQMADHTGMLIIDEIPAVSLNFFGSEADVSERLAMCKQQINELIERDKNHPSVIMWSVANEPFGGMIARALGQEVPDDYDARGLKFLGDLIDLAHELDSTRPATLVGIMTGPKEWLDLADVILINRYYGWYMQTGEIEKGATLLEEELDDLGQLNKPLMISEFGADTMAGLHSLPAKVFSEEYQNDLIQMYLDMADKKDFVIGMHIWNFADFQATQSTGRVGGMNLKGVFTRARNPKLVAHTLRKRWNQ